MAGGDLRKISPQRLSVGTAQNLAAELLVLPAGLLVVAYLTRKLGPHGFGLFTLASTFIGWLAWTSASLFSRATVALVSAADDWRPVAATVMRVHLCTGLLCTVAVWFAADPISVLLGAPDLAVYLRLFSVELSLFAVTRGYRSVLAGVGLFRERASARAAYWVTRIAVIVLLVELGLSVQGAILGSMAATVVEFVMYRKVLRVPFSDQAPIGVAALWTYAAPVAALALSRQLFNRVDLFAITTLGGSVADAGFYGAARNLSLLPGLLAVSLSPLLLSTLRRLNSQGREREAARIARGGLRLVVALLPFAAIVVAASRGIAIFVFGPEFAVAGPLLALLIVAELALLGFSIASTLLVAADRSRTAAIIGTIMLVVAIPAHYLVIPRAGAVGAACVTTVIATAGAVAVTGFALPLWRVPPLTGTAVRGITLAILGYAAALAGPSEGIWLAVYLSVVVALIPGGYYLLGEVKDEDLRQVRSMVGTGGS